MNDNFDNELFKEFMDEVGEYLYALNRNLLQLEAGHGDRRELLNEMFRAAHSTKGMAGMMGFEKMSDLTHKMENILDILRQGKIELSQKVSDILFKAFDCLESILGNLASGEEKEDESCKVLIEIDEVLEEIKTEASSESTIDKSKYIPLFIEETTEDMENMIAVLLKLEQAPGEVALLNEVFRMTHRIKSSAASLGFSDLSEIAHRIEDILDNARQGKIAINESVVSTIFSVADVMMNIIKNLKNNSPIEVNVEDIILRLNKCIPQDDDIISVVAAKKQEAIETELEETVVHTDEIKSNVDIKKENDRAAKSAPSAVAVKKDESSQTLRVDLDKLDILMNLAGEIVIARSQLLKITSNIENYIKDEEGKILVGNLNTTAERISRISVDIQMEVMQTRLVPVGGLFRRFSRVVRDVANLKRKKIVLEILGEETELDKKIVDELGDPLTHLVRNAADHGIEMPAERIEKGKPELGTIKLNAYHEASNICIEISDDGKGIDVNAVREKAISKGLINEVEAQQLTEHEIINFVFSPGFSTAKTVTETSGRGVGLDVVKDKIEQLNGSVSIDTEFGKGTRFILRLPLTLAIVSSILTRISEEIFALPLDSVSEIIRVDSQKIHVIGSQMNITHRDKVLPIIYLHEVLGTEAVSCENKMWNVIVVSSQEYTLGIVVDELIGREDITIKSLGKNSKQIAGVMGASILGDGNVCLILDVAGIFKIAMKKDNQQVKNQTEGIVNE